MSSIKFDRISLQLLLVLVIALAVYTSARAHDELEVSVDAWLSEDGLKLEIVQANRSALWSCLEETGGRLVLGPQKFDEVKKPFEDCFSEYFRLSNMEGETIWPNSGVARLNRENHVEVVLEYGILDGPSAIQADFFDRFNEGIETRGVFTLWKDRKIILRKILTRSDPFAAIEP